MSGPSASPPFPPSESGDDETVRVAPAVPRAAEDETVRTAPPTFGTDRGRVVTAAVALWWAVLAVGVVAQLAVVASGGLSLSSTAPGEAGRIALLFVVAVLFSLPPVAHWLLLTRGVRRLGRGRGRPRPMLTVLAVSSLVFDGVAVLSVDRVVPIVLCGLHAVLVVGAVVVTWLPAVTAWMAGPVALIPHQGTPGAPGAGGAAPAGLAAIPVPAAPQRSRRHPVVVVGVLVAALVALVGHVVLGIGGSARSSLERQITAGIAQQATTPDEPVRCPWALGWGVAMGASGTSTCTVVMSGLTLPVEVRSAGGGRLTWTLG